MFNNYVLFVAQTMQNQNVKYASFVQKFVESDFIRF